MSTGRPALCGNHACHIFLCGFIILLLLKYAGQFSDWFFLLFPNDGIFPTIYTYNKRTYINLIAFTIHLIKNLSFSRSHSQLARRRVPWPGTGRWRFGRNPWRMWSMATRHLPEKTTCCRSVSALVHLYQRHQQKWSDRNRMYPSFARMVGNMEKTLCGICFK